MSQQDELFIVGIGASAGGLEAIRTLLKSSPKDAPAAYVVVQHMSPTQRSVLASLVARETHLETQEVTEDVKPLRNHVYVAPPGWDILFADGMLKLVPHKNDLVTPKPSVDRFFRSIAEELQERAIGIVLSGTGSDGSAGVKSIREAGGITIAQDDKTAKYDGMPNSAVETGCIDLILSPLDIGQRLETLSLSVPHLATALKDSVDQAPLMEILQIVLAKTRVDFRDYKPTTILRRLERRMTAVGIDSQEEYAAYCREHDEEVEELFRDFLISVTRFFRDPEHFDSLGPFIEDMVREKQDQPLRIWIAGCATGEEAYSIAMMVCEAMGGLEKAKRRALRIFATDIDEKALNIARSGRYPHGALSDVPERFIKPYFEIGEDNVTVVSDLRQMIVFSMHNVVQDPPFVNMDLVCCRNLLIYFNQVLQDRTLSNFHYGLNDDGKVFLGTAESATVSDDLFIEIEMGRKVLKKRTNKQIRYDKRARRVRYATPKAAGESAAETAEQPGIGDRSVNDLVVAIAASLGEAALLLTQDLLILHVFGDVTPFISLRPGETQSELDHRLLVDPLAAEVRVLATMVGDDNRSVRGFKRMIPAAGPMPIQLEMLLLKDKTQHGDLYLVAFKQLDEQLADAPDETNADKA
ncbi:MAG: chemotaxis protein CheB, partial [Pseudomonadota bacterium]